MNETQPEDIDEDNIIKEETGLERKEKNAKKVRRTEEMEIELSSEVVASVKDNRIPTEPTAALTLIVVRGKSPTDMDAECKALAGALKDNTTLTSLSLANLGIGDAVIRILAESLKQNKTLQTLILSYNPKITDLGLSALIDTLHNNNFTLHTVALVGNNSSIKPATTKKLKSLLRRNASFRYLGARDLERWIETCSRSASSGLKRSYDDTKECPISWIPNELLHSVLSEFNIYQLMHLRLVCYTWKEIIDNTSIVTELDLSKMPWKRVPLFPDHFKTSKRVPTIMTYHPSKEIFEEFVFKKNLQNFHLVRKLVLPKDLILSAEQITDLLSNCSPWNLKHLSMQYQINVLDKQKRPLPIMKRLTGLKYLNVAGCDLSARGLAKLLRWLPELRTLVALSNPKIFRDEVALWQTKLNSRPPLMNMRRLAISALDKFKPTINEIVDQSFPSLELLALETTRGGFRWKFQNSSMNLIPGKLLWYAHTGRKTPPSQLAMLIEELGIDIDLPHFGVKQRRLSEKAVETRNFALLDFCISHGAVLTFSHLSIAVVVRHKALLAHLADQPVLSRYSSYTVYPLEEALRQENKTFVKWLVAVGFDPNSYATQGIPLLHVAIKRCKALVPYLLRKGGKADMIDKGTNGMTSIMHLVEVSGPPDDLLLDLLIKHGANVNAQPGRRMATVLHLAVKAERKDWLRLLLERGADVNIKNGTGVTPYTWLLSQTENPASTTKAPRRQGKEKPQYSAVTQEMLNILEAYGNVGQSSTANRKGKKEKQKGGRRR